MATQHLNQTELAERWRLSEGSLERWRCEGIGPVYLKIKGRVVYRESDIEDFERQCLRNSTASSAAHSTV